MALAGPGEGPGFVAEQLRVEQIIVQRRAVQRDKRPLPAAGEVVETVSDKLFPGAALADDQHRFIQRSQPGNLFQHLEKAVGLAQQIILVLRHDEFRH